MFCFKYTNVKVLSNNMVNFMMIFFFVKLNLSIQILLTSAQKSRQDRHNHITNDSFLTQRDDPELLSNCRDILKRYWFTVSHKGSKNAVTRFYTLFIAERITALEYYILFPERKTQCSKNEKILQFQIYILFFSHLSDFGALKYFLRSYIVLL